MQINANDTATKVMTNSNAALIVLFCIKLENLQSFQRYIDEITILFWFRECWLLCKLKDEQTHELVKGIVLIKYSCNKVAMLCLAADIQDKFLL